MSGIAYRSDIDGLRAIAVLAIIIYHANSQWLPGGVASLGIFFVISGFLITSIIHREISGGRFSFTTFYTRRIKRILPLFYVVIAMTAIVASWLLSPSEFQAFGKSMRYAVVFLANMYFAKEQDYFAPDAEEMPLLHLWTLSVEEQYYLVWPGLLLLCINRFPRYTLLVSILLGIASFVLATVWAMDKSTAQLSYYSLPSRFGEFLIGSLLALYNPQKVDAVKAACASTVGAILIAGSLILVNDNVVYPGFHALWSCCGTALLIYAGHAQRQPFFNRLLASRVLVFFGLISYSLYLWHWPILAFIRYVTMTSILSTSWVLLCFGLTLVLSYLTWRFVEQPARLKKMTFRQSTIQYFLLPALVILLAAVYIKKTDGYLWRDDSRKIYKIRTEDVGCLNRIESSCQIGDKEEQVRTAIYGDSHAVHLSVFFDRLAKNQQWSANFFAVYGCPFLTGNGGGLVNPQECLALTDYVNAHQEDYDNVILAQRWYWHLKLNGNEAERGRFRQQLEDTIKQFDAAGKQVFLVAQIPEYQKNPLRLFRRHSLGISADTVEPEFVDYIETNNVIRGIADQYDNVWYIDFMPVILGWDNAVVDGVPLYQDSHHLNQFGQEQLYKDITQDSDFDWIGKTIKTKSTSLNR